MRYIQPHARGGHDHTQYWAYLESARLQISPHIFAFASNPENHDLTSPNSLHDSWLESWNVEEISDEARKRSIQIRAKLLGSRHDRQIHLTYGHVRHHSIVSEGKSAGHGDLLIHEMRLAEPGWYIHELLFSEGSTFLVAFRDFAHEIARRL
jgi:hypothetical protein